ncbi:cell division protein ZapA [Persicitalea sp.]|uniref:cell division protein ZapA n=1 Tax=Persicitalea sp. TaxID=3100273 RepID=UPI0035945234
MDKNRQETYKNVFIKILDKGFNLSVPVDQVSFYEDGYATFLQKVEHHKKKHLPEEAVALASIDCMVALQKSQNQLKIMIAALEEQMDDLDTTLLEAL